MKLDFKVLKQHHGFVRERSNSMIVGGYGSAKSHTGTIKTILKKLEYPNYKVAYYLPTYGLIKDIAFDKFPSILQEYGLRYKLNKSDKEIHIENYGTIIFRSMDSPETIVGYEVAYSLIDEADIINKEKMDIIYKKILARNRAIEGANVDVVSTPEGYKWLYEQSKNGHFKVFRAKTKDNKFLPQSYLEALRDQYPPNLLKAYMEGEFINLTSGTVYSYFKRETHHTDATIRAGEDLHIGQDFNVGGCCSTVNVIRDGQPMQLDEFSSHDTMEIITNLNHKYKGHHITIYPDASGNSGHTNASKSDIGLLREAGFAINAPKTNGHVENRVNSYNVKLSKNEFKINTLKCPRSTEALEQQAYDKNGSPEKFGGAATIDDWNDAQGYFIVRKFGINKPSLKQNTLSFA